MKRDRTGHLSNALHKYEKTNEEKLKEVSAVLGPNTAEVQVSNEKEKCLKSSVPNEDVIAGPLNSCSFANCSVKIKVNYLKLNKSLFQDCNGVKCK